MANYLDENGLRQFTTNVKNYVTDSCGGWVLLKRVA